MSDGTLPQEDESQKRFDERMDYIALCAISAMQYVTLGLGITLLVKDSSVGFVLLIAAGIASAAARDFSS